MLCCHQRSGMRRLQEGDAMFFCCCSTAQYRGMWIGFDRTFFVGEPSKELLELEKVCVESQQAALDKIRPGAVFEDVHAACVAVLVANGLSPCYRTGRCLGYGIHEAPELKC